MRDLTPTVALALTALLAFADASRPGDGPIPVSPGEIVRAPVVEARCPTFQWAGVAGAGGYELVVFRLAEAETDPADPVLVTRVSVPGEARGFTPSSADCLERGGRYAWSVAVALDSFEELQWSRPLLFEVGPAPSLEDVEQAIGTLQRYREHLVDRPPSAPASNLENERDDSSSSPASSRARQTKPPSALAGQAGEALRASTSGVTRVAAAVAPSLGDPSLRIGANLAFGASSNVFKDGEVFLWDDVSGNTALGRKALASATGNATGNTAVGREALRDTVGVIFPDSSSYNTAVGVGALRANTVGSASTASGFQSLHSNTTGSGNTASGSRALFSNTTGNINTAGGSRALYYNTTGGANTAFGHNALQNNRTGSRNTAIGSNAGELATIGFDNIFIGSGAVGLPNESNTIRIGGTSSGSGAYEQRRTFINGIRGITTTNTNAIPVLIDSAGQLGTMSSSRAFKQDVEDVGALADRLLELRPVAFRYKQHAAVDPEGPREFGLIAEEVAEVLPELVVFDAEGRPETVRYHLLSSLLLGELQRQQAALRLLQERLDSIEGRTNGARRRDRP